MLCTVGVSTATALYRTKRRTTNFAGPRTATTTFRGPPLPSAGRHYLPRAATTYLVPPLRTAGHHYLPRATGARSSAAAQGIAPSSAPAALAPPWDLGLSGCRGIRRAAPQGGIGWLGNGPAYTEASAPNESTTCPARHG